MRGLHNSGLLAWLRCRGGDLLSCLLLICGALLIGCLNVSGSGTLWPDGPQYANAGAMIHDWILSRDLLHPYQFATRQYAQYPAFHLPFHPPAYPFLLALFFLATGVSYISARVFVALCLGMAGCFFYAIVRYLGTTRAVALGCALLLLTIPEVAHWSRDTMSEVPSLAFILGGSYFFLKWLQTNKFAYCLTAFGFAEIAFLSRVTMAGIIPAWFIFALLTGQLRKLRSLSLALLAATYILINIAWTIFASRFAMYETGLNGGSQESAAHRLLSSLSWSNISFYVTHLPAIAGWGTLVMAALGLIFAVRLWKRKPLGLYWLSWLLSSCGFLLLLRLVPEQRYFFFVMPGCAGLAAVLFGPEIDSRIRSWVAPALLSLCLVTNVVQLRHLPRGVVGYDEVARYMARTDEPGNIMSICWENQDFVFRYQASHPTIERRIIRGDRTLAIRLSEYGGFSGGQKIEPVILAHNSDEVLDIVRRGRIRYLLTCVPDKPQRDAQTHEMILAQEVAQSRPDSFALLKTFPLLIDYENENLHCQVFVWKFLGELPAGPSELPIVVPTADLVIR